MQATEGRVESRGIQQPFFTAGPSAMSCAAQPSQQHSTCLVRAVRPAGQALPPPRPKDLHVPPFDFPIQTFLETGPPSSREDSVKSMERAFNAYGERLRSDLRDMRGLCTQLIAQEKQEAAKWYALCAKVIRERDYARQRVNMLAYGRNGSRALSSLSSSSSSETAAAAQIPNDANRASKRSYEDDESSQLLEGLPPLSRSKSAEARPIRPLRLSPVHSPVGSPTRSTMSPPSSLPPLSASMTPPSSGASTTSIYTNSSDRPVKRTRSREPPSRSSVETTLADSTNRLVLATSTRSPPPRIKQQSRTPSPLTPNSSTLPPASAPAAAPDFSHVDLMYVRRQSSLVCRACL